MADLLEELKTAGERVKTARTRYYEAAKNTATLRRFLEAERRVLIIQFLESPESMGKTERIREAWLQANTRDTAERLEAAEDKEAAALLELDLRNIDWRFSDLALLSEIYIPEGKK